MAEARLSALSVLVLLCAAVSCTPRVTWEKHVMDGHRTGVTAVVGEDVEGAVGYVDSVYHCPLGKTFDCGSTPVVARLLLDAQPSLAYLKEIIASSDDDYKRGRGALANWTVDSHMMAVESLTHRKVDVGIMNYGGIRTDMPKGDVLLEDIISMFPFKNTFVYVSVKGSALRKVFSEMAEHSFQAVGGVKIEVKDHKLVSVLVGGEPLDDDKVYGLSTIDFLLDGGDKLHLGSDAIEVINTGVLIKEWMVSYVKTLGASGVPIHLENEKRVVVL